MSLTLTLKDNGGNPVSGEGTSITLNNTTETNFTKFDLYGDTEQATYSGKNLLNITKGTFTQNGITFTQNPDGSVTMNGTSTGNAYYEMNNTEASRTTITSGVRYTLSIGNVTLPSGQVIVQIRKVNPNTIYAAVSDKSASFTAPETTTTFTYIGVYGVGVKLDNVTIYPMLEVGSSMTSFEPYVGETASPNPAYPQEVKTVTGEQTITLSNGQGESQSYPIDLGKNILKNVLFLNGTDNYVANVLNSDGSITCSGTVGSGWDGWSISGYIANSLPAGTYTFSIDQAISYDINVSFRDAANNTLDTAHITAGQTIATVTLNKPTAKTSLWLSATTGTEINFTSKMQLERGSSASTFAPYVVGFGKNLFDKDNANVMNVWAGTDYIYSGDALRTLYIPCDPSTTYTVQKENTGTNNRFMVFTTAVRPVVGAPVLNYVGTSGAEDNNSSYTITTPANAKYLCVFFSNTNTTTPSVNEILATIQIEKGSSASTYEPNFSGQLELCEIGDYQDYLYKSEGNWYVHREMGKKTVSSEDVTRVYNYTNIDYARVAKPITSVNYGNYNEMQYPILCTHASHILTSGSWDLTDRIGRIFASASANDYWIGFPKDTSGDDMRTILSGAMIYYILATPTDIQITYEPLVAQLEALYNTAHSYNGATIVTSSSQYLPAIMDVTVGGSTNEVTYTETELSNPLTITDIEGKSQNTTLNGNIYVDYVYNKKSFSVSIFNLKSADYATIRGFYDRQFTLNEFPLLSIPELNISEMPVFFEIGSREINSQCIVTDKLTLKFRETAQQ